jgi:soluble lytic murein transglycosylase-like protein
MNEAAALLLGIGAAAVAGVAAARIRRQGAPVVPEAAPHREGEIIPVAFRNLEQERQAAARFDTTPARIAELIAFHATRTGVPAPLIRAIIERESSGNPLAINLTSDGVGGRDAIGLMQVLCPQGLNVTGWCGDRPCGEGGCQRLLDPALNIQVGSEILKFNLETFGWYRGIAAYNQWSQRNAQPGGPFANQRYVDDVIALYDNFGGTRSAGVDRYGAGRVG